MSESESETPNKGSPVYRRKLIGRVSSDKMNKNGGGRGRALQSATPCTKSTFAYARSTRPTTRTNQYKTGDRVEIEEHRPMSAEKRFIVTRLINRPASELG